MCNRDAVVNVCSMCNNHCNSVYVYACAGVHVACLMNGRFSDIPFQDLANQTSSDVKMEIALMQHMYVTTTMTVETTVMNLDVVGTI